MDVEPPAADNVSEQVHDLLEHLYDLAYLQNHLFTRQLNKSEEVEAVQVRRVLLQAIESTNPGNNFYFREPQARPYQMLQLHYVERLTIQKSAQELGISERQAYRDLRQGEENVLAFLMSQAAKGISAEKTQNEEPSKRVAQHGTNLASLALGAITSIEKLAQKLGITLDIHIAKKDFNVPADPAIARQVLVGLLSRAIQQARSTLHIHLRTGGGSARLVLTFTSMEHEPAAVVDPLILGFVRQMGWAYQDEAGPPRQITLVIPGTGLHLLIIDDDEGFISLVRRYLTGYAVQVDMAHNGAEGIRAARQGLPDGILLDVMMPGLDGWQVLQTLRTDPRTIDIPIIVCSVFNDPELANSLGATWLLPKPASQESLQDVFQQTGLLPEHKEE